MTRDAAERAAADLVSLGADREHISTLARGEDGQVSGRSQDGSTASTWWNRPGRWAIPGRR